MRSFRYQCPGIPEKAMATHSSTLAWKISWTEGPGRLQSMGSLRVGHDWATSLSLFTFMHWRRKWQPTPVFLPGESQGWRAWWAAVYGVTQSRIRLKRLSSSSSPGILIDLSLPKSHWSQTNVNGWSFPVTWALPSHKVPILFFLHSSLSIGKHSEKTLLLCNTHVFNPSRL